MGRKKRAEYIYTSPDGGHTIYQQEIGSDVKVKISQDDYAYNLMQAQDEQHMCGWEAVELRKQHPALQEAWNQYVTMWKLCVNDDYSDDYSRTYKLKFIDE